MGESWIRIGRAVEGIGHVGAPDGIFQDRPAIHDNRHKRRGT